MIIKTAFSSAVVALALVIFISTAALADCWNSWSSSEQFFDLTTAAEVKRCLRSGADPNERDSKGFPPLHRMATNGPTNDETPTIIRALLSAGADPTLTMRNLTALEVAKAVWGMIHQQLRRLPRLAPLARRICIGR